MEEGKKVKDRTTKTEQQILAEGVKENEGNLATESPEDAGPGGPRCNRRWWVRDRWTWSWLKVCRDQLHSRSSDRFQATGKHHHPHPGRKTETESTENFLERSDPRIVGRRNDEGKGL